MKVHSCGVVIYRMRDDIEFLLIKQRDYKNGYWIFPKGKQRDQETEEQTAIREAKEEVGLTVKLIKGFRKQITLIEAKDFQKTVAFYVSHCDNRVKIVRDELSGYTWAGVDEARKLIVYPRVKGVLEDAYEFISNYVEEKKGKKK